MSKRLIISIWLSALLVGLLIAIPTTVEFTNHWRAKNYAVSGCKIYWTFTQTSAEAEGVKMSRVRANWSEAARLNPAYIPLAEAGVNLIVERMDAKRYGYEQQWLNSLRTLQGFCDFVINPQTTK